MSQSYDEGDQEAFRVMGEDVDFGQDEEIVAELFSTAHDDSGSDSDETEELKDGSGYAVAGLEDLVLTFLRQLARAGFQQNEDSDDSDAEEISSRAKYGKPKIRLQLADRARISQDMTTPLKTMSYPRKAKQGSCRQFARLFRVLELTHSAILENIPMTKRDIYYNEPKLFGSQHSVDQLVDDLAASFDLERSDLNIRATSKGLICGSRLRIYLHSGEMLSCMDNEGHLIPVGESIKSFELTGNISWVLVVEKDAVFQTLCHYNICSGLGGLGPGIMITGKGYPDMATRHAVKTLADNLPERLVYYIPITALVDGDSFGLDILSIYKYGSRALQHETEKLAAGRLEWIGVFASELDHFGISKEALLPMTRHDERKALSILQRPTSVLPPRWKKELMRMLHMRCKAEIEALSASHRAPEHRLERNTETNRNTTSTCTTISADKPLLLRYVILKLSQAIHQYRPQSQDIALHDR